MKAIDDLLKQPSAWLNIGSNTGSLVSSRVRLARNIDGRLFPDWAGEEESVHLWHDLRSVLASLSTCQLPVVLEMGELNRVDKAVLIERHLISRELAEKGAGSGLVFQHDESISIMVNEEDHLRMQAMSTGLDLIGLWETINRVDSEIESHINYAMSPQLGYLSACPTNVGTGMRASVMLHLPGLALMNEIDPIIKGVSKIGLAVRGLWGEGTEAAGNMFQLSNQTTLGEKEETIIRRIEQIVLEIAEHEKNARARLTQQKEHLLRDHVGRSYGILSQAHLLDSRETLSMLSHLRLGIDMGIVVGWDKAMIDELFLLTQPGHLQKMEGKRIGAEKRDLARARLVRRRLARQCGNQKSE